MKNNTVIVLTSKLSSIGLPAISGISFLAKATYWDHPENGTHPNQQMALARELEFSKFENGIVIFTKSIFITRGLLNRKNVSGEDIRFYYVDEDMVVEEDNDLELFNDSWNDAFAWGLDVALGIIDNDVSFYNLK